MCERNRLHQNSFATYLHSLYSRVTSALQSHCTSRVHQKLNKEAHTMGSGPSCRTACIAKYSVLSRRDATVEFSRVSVGGVNTIRNQLTSHDDCRRVRSQRRHDSTPLRCWKFCSDSSRLSPTILRIPYTPPTRLNASASAVCIGHYEPVKPEDIVQVDPCSHRYRRV